LGNTVRHCTPRLHQQVATDEFMGVLVKLIKVPGLSITVSFLVILGSTQNTRAYRNVCPIL